MPLLWWFAETTIVAGVLALAAWSLGRWKRIGLGPGARHLLWLVVLVKLLTPPVVSWPKGEPRAGRSVVVETPVVRSEIPAPVAPRPTVPKPVPRRDAPAKSRATDLAAVLRVDRKPAPAPSPDAFDEAWRSFDAPAPIEPPRRPAKAVIPNTKPASNPPPAVIPPPPPFDLTWLVPIPLGLWALGTACVATLQGVRIARFARRLRFASGPPAWLADDVERISTALNVTPPRIRVLPGLGGPMLWCLGRATLLVPAELIERLREDRWPGVLTHELAHLRRRDHWVARMELLAELIWWWNPIFHLTRRRLREEAELASDAWVVRVGPEAEERRRYAEALVDVCEHLSRLDESRGAALRVGVAGSAKALEGRLLMILREVNPKPTPGRWALAAAVLALLSLPAWSAAPQQKKESTPTARPSAPKADAALPPPNPNGVPTGIPIPARPDSANPESRPNAPASLIANDNAPGGENRPSAPVGSSSPTSPGGDRAAMPPQPASTHRPSLLQPPPQGRSRATRPSLLQPPPQGGSGAPRAAKAMATPDLDRIKEALRERSRAVQNLEAQVIVSRERRSLDQSSLSEKSRTVSVQSSELTLGQAGFYRIDSISSVIEAGGDTGRMLQDWSRVYIVSDGLKAQKLTKTSNNGPLSRSRGDEPIDADQEPDLQARDFVSLLQGIYLGDPFETVSMQVANVLPRQMVGEIETFPIRVEYRPKKDYIAQGTIWLAPAMGYATVRSEIMLRQGEAGGHGRFVRVQLRDFVNIGGVFIARRVEAVDDKTDGNPAYSILARNRIRAQISRIVVNRADLAKRVDHAIALLVDSVDEEGDGPSTTPLQDIRPASPVFKMPPLPEDMLAAYREGIMNCPFGTPGQQSTASPPFLTAPPSEPVTNEPMARKASSPPIDPTAATPPPSPLGTEPALTEPEPARSRSSDTLSAPSPVPSPAQRSVPDLPAESPSPETRLAPPQPATRPLPDPVDDATEALPPPKGDEVAPGRVPAARSSVPQPVPPDETRLPMPDEPRVPEPVPAPVAPGPVLDPAPPPRPARPSPVLAEVAEEASKARPPVAQPQEVIREPSPVAPVSPAVEPAPPLARSENATDRVVEAPELSPRRVPPVEIEENSALPPPPVKEPVVPEVASPRDDANPLPPAIESAVLPPSPESEPTEELALPTARTRTPQPARDPFAGGDEPTFDLITQRDQIELLETRLPARKAELEAAEVKLAIALEKLTYTEKLKAKGMVSAGEVGVDQGASKITKAERDQKAAELREAELMVTQAKRRYARDEARVKREIERLKEELEFGRGRVGLQTVEGVLSSRRDQRRLELLQDQLPTLDDVAKLSPSEIQSRKRDLDREIREATKQLEQLRRMVRTDSDPAIQAARRKLNKLGEEERKLDRAHPEAPVDPVENERIEGRRKLDTRSAPVQ